MLFPHLAVLACAAAVVCGLNFHIPKPTLSEIKVPKITAPKLLSLPGIKLPSDIKLPGGFDLKLPSGLPSIPTILKPNEGGKSNAKMCQDGERVL